jgi:hypothetical protein
MGKVWLEESIIPNADGIVYDDVANRKVKWFA